MRNLSQFIENFIGTNASELPNIGINLTSNGINSINGGIHEIIPYDHLKSVEDSLSETSNSIVKYLETKDLKDTQTVIPLVGGAIQLLDSLNKVQNSSIDIEEYKSTLVFYGLEDDCFYNINGEKVALDKKNILIVDDIADGLNTYKSIAKHLFEDPVLFAPYAKYSTFNVKDVDFNKIFISSLIPYNNENDIWISGGGGMNRGQEDSLFGEQSYMIKVLQRVCSNLYFVDQDFNIESEIEYLYRNIIPKFRELVLYLYQIEDIKSCYKEFGDSKSFKELFNNLKILVNQFSPNQPQKPYPQAA